VLAAGQTMLIFLVLAVFETKLAGRSVPPQL